LNIPISNYSAEVVATHNFIGIIGTVSSISSKKWISARRERAFFLSSTNPLLHHIIVFQIDRSNDGLSSR
jgi:hypothetical protein